MKWCLDRASITLGLLCILTSSASAQRFLDWPLRTTAGPEAVVRGAEAAFWNPGAIFTGATRGQVIVADQRTPDLIGIGGFAAAAAWRLDARTTIAAGYQHVSIDDIGETSTSPLPDAGAPSFSISEDQVLIGASHALGPAVTAGAVVRYDRSDETGIAESTTSLGGGFLFSPSVSLRPVVGGSMVTHEGGVRYMGGAEVGSSLSSVIHVRAGYGLRGGEKQTLEHRIAVSADWRGALLLTGGVVTADSGERSWEPVLGASLRVSKYELGVLRETLANDFGAAYSFRLRFGFK